MLLRSTYAVLKPKLYNFASNTYLSTKPLFFNTFILVILSVFVMTTMFNKDNSKTVQVFTVILARN